MDRWYNIFGWAIAAVIIGVVALCCGVADSAKAVPVESSWVYLKSGGDFTHWAKVSDVNDFDRMINKKNVATVRKIGKDTILLDGNINIKFSSSEERDTFLKALTK